MDQENPRPVDVDVSEMGHHTKRQVNELRDDVLCGIDPGREKFGLALGNAETLIMGAVVPVTDLDTVAGCIASGDFRSISVMVTEGTSPRGLRIGTVYVGNGTGTGPFTRRLDELGVRCFPIDERMTTLEARSLYWRLHPPSGLWRVIPLSLRTPPRPVDDMAAWSIIIRGVKSGR
jgi:RNase H-fold protein (predicted Holliday junction resolvase)